MRVEEREPQNQHAGGKVDKGHKIKRKNNVFEPYRKPQASSLWAGEVTRVACMARARLAHMTALS